MPEAEALVTVRTTPIKPTGIELRHGLRGPRGRRSHDRPGCSASVATLPPRISPPAFT